MDKKTVKTILIVIGSGIGGILLFIAVIVGFAYYQYYNSSSQPFFSSPPDLVSTPPDLIEQKGFLGSGGIYSGDFSDSRNKVLAEGQGRMVGKITAHGEPIEGLRLRLALNGSVMSQWAVSDSAGIYTISLPYGKYRIDGYELDYSTANSALAGKTDNPQNAHSSEIMVIGEGKPGKGLNLDYVEPVIIKGPAGEVSLSNPIIISWEPYPNAGFYRVQLVEEKDPRDFREQKRLFEWSKRPKIQGTSFDISEYGIELKKGYYYTVEIDALDINQWKISESAGQHGSPNFWVVE